MYAPKLCIACKGGKYLCGNKPCPLLSRVKVAPRVAEKVDKEFFGPSTSIFVGHNFYPNVYVGPLGALEYRQEIESPGKWLDMSYTDIIEMRSFLLRSKVRENVKSRSKFIFDSQELALAKRPVDVEMRFKKKPVIKVSLSDIHQPMGPSGTLNRLNVTDNVKIARVVDKVVNDEIKSVEATSIMFSKGVDVYKINTILSSGSLGLEKNKKLVPTRWSITATDDILTKEMLKEIRTFPSINEFEVYEHTGLDNHLVILLMPGNFEYEGFEAWSPGSTWYDQSVLQELGIQTTNLKPMVIEEYEPYKGRTRYADKQGGGYYAARFGVVEQLYQRRRQARVLVFREIGDGYTIPLGVWQVRENVRRAMQTKPVRFNTMQEALNYCSSKLKLSLKTYKSQSELLRQRRVSDFF